MNLKPFLGQMLVLEQSVLPGNYVVYIIYLIQVGLLGYKVIANKVVPRAYLIFCLHPHIPTLYQYIVEEMSISFLQVQ